ncbi:MAG: FAD-binding oxidoreductase [Actinomycetota bacterium]|nr:FAD-binding oxidoreductase [Actinomycetota bacterium]
MADVAELSITGRIATAAAPDWDDARQAWNLAADQRPAAVAFVEGADDVSAVLRFAAERGMKVNAQGTGHGAGALTSLDDTILIRTARMKDVEVDADQRTARIEAGVLAEELGAAAQKHGMSSLPGSSPNVGTVGYTLGGGMGWLGRRHGFACNRVRAIELVTADGEKRRVDADNEPDLFWALRGGGGGYAIVTALEVALLPISEAYAGALIFPAELGAEAVRTYRDWTRALPDEVTSIGRFLRPPPMPDVPEPLRDRPLWTVTAACIGSREEGERHVAPLRELGEPVMDTFDQIPAAGLSRINMDPEPPVPALGHHRLVRELTDEAIDALVGVVGPEAGSPLLLTELCHAGGALGRPAEGGGALSKLDTEFVMVGIGVAMTPELGEALPGALDRLHDALEPWSAEGGYFNFADRPCDVDELLPRETCERLADVKRRWDPDGLIRANHAVSLTPA